MVTDELKQIVDALTAEVARLTDENTRYKTALEKICNRRAIQPGKYQPVREIARAALEANNSSGCKARSNG